MNEVLYILFGWTLGLLSPTIIGAIQARRRSVRFLSALSAELGDLQIRLICNSLMLGQKFGKLDREYLVWILVKLRDYRGDEPIEKVITQVESLIENGPENEKIEHMRAGDGVSISLKNYSASYLESNLEKVSGLPEKIQMAIHEFRNSLSFLNQETLLSNEFLKLSWDTSITGPARKLLHQDMNNRYAHLQIMSTQASRKIEAILALTQKSPQASTD